MKKELVSTLDHVAEAAVQPVTPQTPSIPTRNHTASCHDLTIPAYLRETYRWAYLTPTSLAVLDHQWIVNAILLGNYHQLERAVLTELQSGSRVLQPACVYGRFSGVLAQHIGANGQLDVTDIAAIQIDNCQRKLRGHHQAHTQVADATTAGVGLYDAICCFFLLHEVPDAKKTQIIDGLLNRLGAGGKLVFVDYHRPLRLHPLRWLISLTFAWLEPFARALWQREIMDFASHASHYRWHKKTYFWGMYQKVVVELATGPRQ